ncbi:cytochrome P450 [Mycena latifolia]|nr:cytochrome P450 [Mycena latifolia]
MYLGFLQFNFILLNCHKTLHKARDLVNAMESTANKLIAEKKAAVKGGQLDVDDGSRDIMSLLLKGNLMADEDMFLTNDELVAQTGMIISAATDTTSSALGRCFHLLALHPDIQETLRAEILESPEQMDYDELGALPYLDAFVHEALRLTVQETILPLATPITGVDGSEIRSIPVPKGTSLYIAIAAANHNKQIWGEDALEFKPERWQNGKAGAGTEKMCGIYGNMMTFLGGVRSCIGFQFSLLEIKVVLSVLLRDFIFSPSDAAVKWKLPGIIAVPSVDGQVRLPLVVESVKHT